MIGFCIVMSWLCIWLLWWKRKIFFVMIWLIGYWFGCGDEVVWCCLVMWFIWWFWILDKVFVRCWKVWFCLLIWFVVGMILSLGCEFMRNFVVCEWWRLWIGFGKVVSFLVLWIYCWFVCVIWWFVFCWGDDIFISNFWNCLVMSCLCCKG